MKMKRLQQMSEEPTHHVESGESPIRFFLQDTGDELLFFPKVEEGKLTELKFNFPKVCALRGLIDAMCSVLRNRPWFHAYDLNLREIKSFISDQNEEPPESLSNDLEQLQDLAKCYASLLGKTLLMAPEKSYRGNFIEDLAVLEDSWSKNMQMLFPDQSIIIRLQNFRPPVIGVKLASQTGFESEVLQFLKENLAFITGQTQWKLVAL